MTDRVILAIDPGTTRSAWVVLGHANPRAFAIWENERLRDALADDEFPDDLAAVVIEKVEGYGMAVGADVFETVFWSGMFAEAARPLPVHRIGRGAVKTHLCGNRAARDSNIRQALIDRYGGTGGKSAAIGLKGSPGPLYGVSKDVWAALAVAVTWADQEAAP